jgi:hypothetical protein
MSRSIRMLVAVLVLSVAFGVSACADATAPHPACDYSNGNVCK